MCYFFLSSSWRCPLSSCGQMFFNCGSVLPACVCVCWNTFLGHILGHVLGAALGHVLRYVLNLFLLLKKERKKKRQSSTPKKVFVHLLTLTLLTASHDTITRFKDKLRNLSHARTNGSLHPLKGRRPLGECGTSASCRVCISGMAQRRQDGESAKKIEISENMSKAPQRVIKEWSSGVEAWVGAWSPPPSFDLKMTKDCYDVHMWTKVLGHNWDRRTHTWSAGTRLKSQDTHEVLVRTWSKQYQSLCLHLSRQRPQYTFDQASYPKILTSRNLSSREEWRRTRRIG